VVSERFCDTGILAQVHVTGDDNTSECTGQRRWVRRQQTIEPVIAHLKADHRMDLLLAVVAYDEFCRGDSVASLVSQTLNIYDGVSHYD
jgi:hypothetical protein